jgi:hypothetical protein
LTDKHDYWDSFYASRKSEAVPHEPTAFARWVEPLLPRGETLIEFGFGNARDSFWFCRQGHPVRGYDFAESAVDHAQAHANDENLDARFQTLDLYDGEAVASVRSELQGTRPAIYGRFLIHAVEAAGRHHLFDLAAHSEGTIHLEFRTGQDKNSKHLFGEDHFRNYLDPQDVEGELKARGASILRSEAGHGLAVYKSEDPHVARIVASWGS